LVLTPVVPTPVLALFVKKLPVVVKRLSSASAKSPSLFQSINTE